MRRDLTAHDNAHHRTIDIDLFLGVGAVHNPSPLLKQAHSVHVREPGGLGVLGVVGWCWGWRQPRQDRLLYSLKLWVSSLQSRTRHSMKVIRVSLRAVPNLVSRVRHLALRTGLNGKYDAVI